MSWRYGSWTVEHPLPLGATDLPEVGRAVVAGDALAGGTALRSAVRIDCARRLGVAADDLGRVLRVAVGDEVRRGAVLARTGRRFARVSTAPFDGRLVHVSGEGDLWFVPSGARWAVRSVLTGVVVRATPASVVVEGSGWALGGIAAWGPDAVGVLAVGVESAEEELSPHGLDVRLRDRILVGGARIAAEAVTRAHACGVAGLVAGAVPAGGLRAVYGDDVTAFGGPTREDRPTLLCLVGFGAGALPPELFAPLGAFAGALAAVHVASARLFVFAPADAGPRSTAAPALALLGDWSAVRAAATPPAPAAPARFASGHHGEAFATPEGPLPRANLLPFDAVR